MPIATLNGKSGYITDAQVQDALALGYSVTPDGGGTTASTTGGVAIDPTLSQSQWLLNYLLQAKDRGISQFGQDTTRMNVAGGLANTQYGNETSRAGVAGNLYATLFGTPANYGAVSNLMRGQPNASGLSFWNAIAGRGHLGEGAITDPRGRLHNIDPDTVISDLFGGVASSGRPSGGGGPSSTLNKYGRVDDPDVYEHRKPNVPRGAHLNKYGEIDDPNVYEHRKPNVGYAGGGGMVIEHPAEIHLADGRVIPIGEYGRPERVTVTPLATNPLPPRYYAGLMPGSQDNGLALARGDYPPGYVPQRGPLQPIAGGTSGGWTGVRGASPYEPGMRPMPPVEPPAGVQLNDYSGPPIPDTRYVLPVLGGAGGKSAGGWTGAHPPDVEMAPPPLDPRFTVPIGPVAPPSGMAQGGALVFGGGAPAVLYPGATVTASASSPSDTGQVTSASTHAGQTSTGPYYNRMPWADPRTAQTETIMNLSPLEKSLLESTTAAQGLPASEWWAAFQRSRPAWQQAATGAAWSRAA